MIVANCAAPPCLRCITNRSITYDAHFDGDKDVCQYKQAGDDELQTEVSHVTPQRDHVATVPLLKGVLRYQVPGNKKLSFIHFVPWTNCLWLIGPGRSLIVWLKYQLSIYVLLFQPTQKLDLRKVP